MKVFKISSSGWEIYGEHSLINESKTSEEFEQDCRDVLKEVFKEVTETLDKKNLYMSAFHLMQFAIPKLIELGYQELEVECDYNVPGDDTSFIGNSHNQQEAIDELGADVVEAFVHKAKLIDNGSL